MEEARLMRNWLRVPGREGSSFPSQSQRMAGPCPGCLCVCGGNCLLCPTEEGSKEMELKMKGLLVGPHWEQTHGSRVMGWTVSPSPPPLQFIC